VCCVVDADVELGGDGVTGGIRTCLGDSDGEVHCFLRCEELSALDINDDILCCCLPRVGRAVVCRVENEVGRLVLRAARC